MSIEKEALDYHEFPTPGKIFTGLKKSVDSKHDLTIAYSPGVAVPCLAIEKNQDDSFRYTGRGNLVGVISNGTAVLGLGDIGPYASKPVMEGKAMLFKKFADIDVFDIELDAKDPDKFIAAVQALEPTLGGINLEDIKAPDCFYIEEKLKSSMKIPVMHDDQHGTAIIAGAAFLNALEITQRKIDQVKVVFSGAGAAAIGCASMFLELGVKPENLILCDSKGVVHAERSDLNQYKKRFAHGTKLRTIAEALNGADAFVGVSVANALEPDMIKGMAQNPIIFALANPDPEIHPDVAKKVRPDAIIATGRSDFPNQVNNLLGFPFIFRGALDVRATCVNQEMKMAAVKAIAELAKKDVPEEVMQAYNSEEGYFFGRDYLIPKPIDPRVLFHVAPAVAKAAIDSGVARNKIDMAKYHEQIEGLLGPSRRLVRKIRSEIAVARNKKSMIPRIVMPFSLDNRILRAAAQVTEEAEVKMILLGSEKRILAQTEALGIKNFGRRVQIINPLKDERAEKYAEKLYDLRQRKGVSRTGANVLIHNPNYFAAMMLNLGEADGIVSGVVEPYASAVKPILETVGLKKGQALSGIYMMVAKQKLFFFSDCTINIDPNPQTLAEIAITSAEVAKRYTQDEIKIAMLSFASFGATRHPHTTKVAKAVEILREKAPDLVVDGEMQADVALDTEMQQSEFPFCRLHGQANVLIFPDLDSANISYKLLINLADTHPIGPILSGVGKPANVLQRSATQEEIVNMIYVTAHQAMME